MLQVKYNRAGVWFEEVNEAYSTQSGTGCQECTGPKERGGLRIRACLCGHCATVKHRDINAARNIFAAGDRRLAVGITALSPLGLRAVKMSIGSIVAPRQKGEGVSTSNCCSMKNQLGEQRKHMTWAVSKALVRYFGCDG